MTNYSDVFRTGEKEGEWLFYPWDYPGEAVHVTEKQKKKIIFFRRVGKYSSWILIFGIIASSVMRFIDTNQMYYLIAASLMLLSLYYIVGMFFLTKSAVPYKLSIQDRPKKSIESAGYFGLSVAAQIIAVFAMLEEPSVPVLILGICLFLSVAYSVFIIWFIKTIHKTKGYFFFRNS